MLDFVSLKRPLVLSSLRGREASEGDRLVSNHLLLASAVVAATAYLVRAGDGSELLVTALEALTRLPARAIGAIAQAILKAVCQ